MNSKFRFLVLATFSLLTILNTAKADNCYRDVCVGDHAVNLLRDNREVKVLAIENGTKFVVRFEDNGGIGGNWDREDLALMRGCAADLCVGFPALNVSREYAGVTVHAIQWNNKYVLRYNDGRGIGAKWDRSDLAIAWGCVRDLCVNDKIFNRTNARQAKIAAIQTNDDGIQDRMVLDYGASGLGGNWNYEDLILIEKGPIAYPPDYPSPPPPYCPPGTHWDPRLNRCVANNPPPPPYCPPGTHWDPRLNRCVANNPPPPPYCPPGTHWDPRLNRCVANNPPPPPPPYCPPGTHWDPRLNRCVANNTQPPSPPPVCPPGTHWDSRLDRCVANHSQAPATICLLGMHFSPQENSCVYDTEPHRCKDGGYYDPKQSRCIRTLPPR